jgi:hypothetical protein
VTLQGGLGDNLWIDGLDVSGDISALGQIRSPLTVQDTTAINLSAVRRLGLLHDGGMDYTALWNPGAAADTAHSIHKTLPTADRALTYTRGTALGAHAASMIGKQIGYDGTRNADGSFTLSVAAVANGFGLEWGQLLTVGKQTLTGAGNGTGVDLGAVSTLFGWAMYLQTFAFTGTSVTIKVQDSADNSAWLDLASATFAAASAVGSQRVSAGATSTATVRRYARIVAAGTFSEAIVGVNFVRYEAGGHQ